MPNTREKLIELILNTNLGMCIGRRMEAENIAENLIANGVTVQKWIPVSERLPEKDVLVLYIGARGGMFLGTNPWLFSDGSAYFSVPNSRRARFATHWMPLPEPPETEEN